MAEIKLVTQNDEPALALGEYLLSEDGETLYVGSAGVESGSSEIIYKGISPAQIKYGLFSRLAIYNSTIITDTPTYNITQNFIRIPRTNNRYINYNNANITISLEEV